MRYFWRIRRDLFQSGAKKGGVWLECSEDAPVHTLPENAEGKAGLAELHLRLQSAPPSPALPSPALPNLHKLELERLTESLRERESSTQGGAGQGSLSCLYSRANCFSSQIKLQCPPYIGVSVNIGDWTTWWLYSLRWVVLVCLIPVRHHHVWVVWLSVMWSYLRLPLRTLLIGPAKMAFDSPPMADMRAS